MNQEIVWALLALGLLTLCLLAWMALVLARSRSGTADAELQRKDLQDLRNQLQAGHERLERELRREITESSQGARQELSQNLATVEQKPVAEGFLRVNAGAVVGHQADHRFYTVFRRPFRHTQGYLRQRHAGSDDER